MPTNHPPVPTAVDPLQGRVLDGRYRVESFLARGGMATIYRGADLRLERTVAIKVMHPTFASDPGFVDRFDREARAAARLNSPYAVAVHDQGNDAGVTYLVMEYVPGHTVRDVLRAHGPLHPAQALAIIDPVLQALAAAHRAGYIHRDIKPENVLISEDGRVKVTDFGLARAIEGADTGRTHGLLLGTVAYLSPEQVEHDHTDARSDVYSTGILLFELVTGQVPFTGSAPMQVAYRHVHEDVPPPTKIRPELPAGIDALVRGATHRQPDQRFGDADAFLAAVRTQRDALPPAEAWTPAPTDTLVVSREPDAPKAPAGPAAVAAAGAAVASGAGAGDSLAAPDWVSQSPAAAPPGAAPTGATPGSAAHEPDASGSQSQAPGAAAPNHWAAAQGEVGHSQTRQTEVSHQTSPDAAGRPRRGRKALWLGALAAVCVAALLLLTFGPLARVTVPDVSGRTPTEASAILAPSNLTLDAGQTAFSEDFAKGLIIATDPAAESKMRTGGVVHALVSKGPERYDVPKLKNMTLEEAEVALGAANLVLGERSEAYHDTVDAGAIISSDPASGESVKRDTPVAVVVSKGPEPVTVPDLEGTDGDAAEQTLTDLGLVVERKDKTSESVAKGLVISTKPEAGAGTFRGETVELVVSKGPPLVEVPNVVGQGEQEARSILEGAGFVVSVNKPLGFVVFGVNSQNPKGGTKAPKGSTVSITVV